MWVSGVCLLSRFSPSSELGEGFSQYDSLNMLRPELTHVLKAYRNESHPFVFNTFFFLELDKSSKQEN